MAKLTLSGGRQLPPVAPPNINGGIGIQSIMPFVGQAALMNALQQKTLMGQQAVNQQAPQGMVPQGLQPGQISPSYGNPQYGALEDQAKEANDALIKGNTAINQLQYGVSRFKALQNANQASGTMPGIMQKGLGIVGQMRGAVGDNPDEQAWNEYTRTVATQLSAAASPRTPTLLVEYYQHALGPANQTQQEFERRVHNIVSEQKGRQSSYFNKPYSQDEADSETARILSAPPAKDPSNFFQQESPDSQHNIPQSGTQMPGMNSNVGSRIRVRNKVSGQTGTISEPNFDPSKYERVA